MMYHKMDKNTFKDIKSVVDKNKEIKSFTDFIEYLFSLIIVIAIMVRTIEIRIVLLIVGVIILWIL